MRVLHVTPTYAPSIGGIEEVVANLARLGRAAGLQADVVHVAPGLGHGERRQDTFSVWTMPLIGHRMLGWAPTLSRLASGYDLLHVHDPQIGALTLNVGGAAARVPAVLSTHGGFFHTRSAALAKRFHARFTAPRLLRRYARIMASSPADMARFRHLSPNVVLMENGVDTTRLSPATVGGHGDMHRWIFWGRFARNKRIDSLIRLVAALANQGVTIDLALCGTDFDGSLAAARSLVASLKLQRQVTFHIGLHDDALRAQIATRPVFVLPSEYEGFGLSIIEAMAAGLIPLCRDIAPMNVLAGEAAVLLQFDGGAADLRKVRELLAAPQTGIDARRNAASTRAASFDWATRFDAFLQQYRECAGAGPAMRH